MGRKIPARRRKDLKKRENVSEIEGLEEVERVERAASKISNAQFNRLGLERVSLGRFLRADIMDAMEKLHGSLDRDGLDPGLEVVSRERLDAGWARQEAKIMGDLKDHWALSGNVVSDFLWHTCDESSIMTICWNQSQKPLRVRSLESC